MQMRWLRQSTGIQLTPSFEGYKEESDMRMKLPIMQPLRIDTSGNRWEKAKAWASPRKWMMVEDWYFVLPNGPPGVIPKGFIFDGVSVLRVLWWFLSPTGLLLMPAIVHDYAYKHDELLVRVPPVGAASTHMVMYRGAGRKYWDNIFLHMCNEVNGIKVLNAMAWVALRLGGGVAWRNHRNK